MQPSCPPILSLETLSVAVAGAFLGGVCFVLAWAWLETLLHGRPATRAQMPSRSVFVAAMIAFVIVSVAVEQMACQRALERWGPLLPRPVSH